MGKQAKAYKQRPVQSDYTGFHALAAGIILQAVEDWKEAKKKLNAAQSIPDRFRDLAADAQQRKETVET